MSLLWVLLKVCLIKIQNKTCRNLICVVYFQNLYVVKLGYHKGTWAESLFEARWLVHNLMSELHSSQGLEKTRDVLLCGI